jgi:hypothetical protein
MFSYLAGCASPTPSNTYTLILDDSLSLSDMNNAAQAVTNWETTLDHKLSITMYSGHCSRYNDLEGTVDYALGTDAKTICMQGSTAANIASMGAAADEVGFTLRLADIDSSTIYLPIDRDRSFDDAEMQQIIGHELGHAMGLSHTQSGTLMCWYLGCAATLPSCDDYAQWANVRGESDKNVSCPQGGSYTLQH